MSRIAFCLWLKSIIVMSVCPVAEIAIPLFEITKVFMLTWLKLQLVFLGEWLYIHNSCSCCFFCEILQLRWDQKHFWCPGFWACDKLERAPMNLALMHSSTQKNAMLDPWHDRVISQRMAFWFQMSHDKSNQRHTDSEWCLSGQNGNPHIQIKKERVSHFTSTGCLKRLRSRSETEFGMHKHRH